MISYFSFEVIHYIYTRGNLMIYPNSTINEYTQKVGTVKCFCLGCFQTSFRHSYKSRGALHLFQTTTTYYILLLLLLLLFQLLLLLLLPSSFWCSRSFFVRTFGTLRYAFRSWVEDSQRTALPDSISFFFFYYHFFFYSVPPLSFHPYTYIYIFFLAIDIDIWT